MMATKRAWPEQSFGAPSWKRWWSHAKRRCIATIALADNATTAHRPNDDVDAKDHRTLLSLPPEVVAMIAGCCAIDTLVRFQRTCRLAHEIASRALDARRHRVMVAQCDRSTIDCLASYFIDDDANGVAVSIMTGVLTGNPICFAGGEQCVLDFNAIRAGYRPFDCEVHFGGAFLTMSAVALAVWLGAPRVLALLASTRLGVGRSRDQLLGAVGRAAQGPHYRTRPYPVGAMIDTVIGMTQPAGLLSCLKSPLSPHGDAPPLLMTLLCSAQEAARRMAHRRTYHICDKEVAAAIAVLGASRWQLDRLIERACGSNAYNERDRARAFDLVLSAADEVQLAMGVKALINAGMGADVRDGVCGRTIRQSFFALGSQEPIDGGASSADPAIDIARAALAQLVMILCDAPH